MIARRFILACLLLVLAACTTRGGTVDADHAFVGVAVVPMRDSRTVLSDQTVLVHDGRIVAVGPRERVPIPATARRIDGAGRWLVPGLVDMHVHLEHVEDPDILKLFLAHGVTTVRSMDGRPFILEWRRRVANGELPGPRIVTAGPILDGAPPARDDNLALATPAEARNEVRRQAAAGYDFIKTYVKLSPEAYRAVLDEAETQGLPVSGHVPDGVPLSEAAAAQWSLEHLGDFASAVSMPAADMPTWARRLPAAPLDPDRTARLARMLAQAGVWVVPTVVERDRALAPSASVDRWLADPVMRDLPTDVAEYWEGMARRASGRLGPEDWPLVEQGRANRIALLQAFREANVRMAVGSDTPNAFVVPGDAVHHELANLVAAGFTPGEALAAATAHAGRMLERFADIGTIEPGRSADLLLLSADPLRDVAALRQRVGVMAGGRWYGEAELQAMRDDLREREP